MTATLSVEPDRHDSVDAAYEAAKRLIRGGEDRERLALAVAPTTPAELLYFLAGDAAPLVRAAVAANAATPPQADRRLAEDADPRIRALLGRKLAPRAGRLAGDPHDRLGGLGWQTLMALATDLADAVRAVIAEEVKDLPDAPRELILRLARDAAMNVAEPVIRCSPLLTEEDLLGLVRQPPTPATVTAIARRPGLSETLSDAVVAASVVPAIRALLENHSAAIREATLDRLIVDAAREPEWQPSLIARPALSPAALRALASAIGEHLLDALAARPDLDAEAVALLRQRVRERAFVPVPIEPPAEGAVAFAEAARGGDRYAMRRLLAKSAKVTPALVERAERLRSPKALLGLAHAAGFTPQLGLLAQTVLAGLSAAEALAPAPDGGWPITAEELAWQLQLIGAR